MTPTEIRSSLGRALVAGNHRVPFVAFTVVEHATDAYADGIRWHRLDRLWAPYSALAADVDRAIILDAPSWNAITVMYVDESTGPVDPYGAPVRRVEADAVRCCRPGETIDGFTVCALDRGPVIGTVEVAWLSRTSWLHAPSK